MIYEVLIAAEAEQDLRRIYEYICLELKSPKSAKKQINSLEAAINSLTELPFRHRVFEHEPWKSRGLRIFPVGNYLVFYIVDKSSRLVNIVRIMYGKRDIKKHL
ncbi:MAG: type II toxin-antitoxin system RelE/ParE family toxin [Enterococcus sp.]|nr:type II toxin-antitoxin system RelE/ParE family toxin [Enterococcus sp.]